MLWFWLAVGAMACAATASLALPLVLGGRRLRAAARQDDEARRVAVYRDRRGEIEADRAAGRLTEEEASRALDELIEDAAVQLAPAAAQAATPDTGAGRGASRVQSTVLGLLAALVVPAVALAVYSVLGTPDVVGLDRAALRGEMSPLSLAQSISSLRERVRKSPDDAEAWVMLGQAQRLSGEHAASVVSFEKASALMPAEAWLIAEQAESVMLSQGGSFSGRPLQLLERALAVDPEDSKAIALMSAAQFRLGNLDAAIGYMKKLAQRMPAGSRDAQHIEELIARIESERGGGGGLRPGTASPRAGAPATSGAGASAAAAASGSGTAPGAAPAASSSAATVTGTVTIDPKLADQVPAGATLFVLARGADGSRVPIAAQRLRVDGWPVAFELGDAQAMNPARLISQADSVIVEARVSRGGTAGRNSGDPFGVTAVVKTGTRGLVVHIDQQVP